MSSPVYPRPFDWAKGYLEIHENGEKDTYYVMDQGCGNQDVGLGFMVIKSHFPVCLDCMSWL